MGSFLNDGSICIVEGNILAWRCRCLRLFVYNYLTENCMIKSMEGGQRL